MATSLSMAGCFLPDLAAPSGVTPNLHGGAVADEPRAVLVARDTLAAGGNAADAMVALYFTLAVTMPHVAGLGGGGQCVFHDGRTKKVDVVSFPVAPFPSAPTFAIPGNARGMAALWARHGKTPWNTLVAPGEAQASQGQVSRALARDLEAFKDVIAADPHLAMLYLHADGTPLKEGEALVQPELGGVLGEIRGRGGAELTAGRLSQKFTEDIAALGISISSGELRANKPEYQEPREFPFGDESVAMPKGAFADAVGGLLSGGEARAPHEPNGPTPQTTSAVTFDEDGDAVACAFSMNGPFGSGKYISGMGLALAAPGSLNALPLLLVNKNNREFYIGGGADAANVPVLLHIMTRLFKDKIDVNAAMLESPSAGASFINVAFCPNGSPRDPELCVARNDPRGSGLASLTPKSAP